MFQCALVEIDEINFTISTNGTQYVAQVPVGYDDQTLCRYSIFVAFVMVPGYGNDTKELTYCLTEYDAASDTITDIWDSAVVRAKIPNSNHRSAILSAVCQAIEALIDEASPNVVTMVTYTPHLPEKALAKYQRVQEIFAARGYKVGKSDVWHGSHTWMMERQT